MFHPEGPANRWRVVAPGAVALIVPDDAGMFQVFTRCATPPTATRLYSKAQGQSVVGGRHPGLWAQRRICTLKECDNFALLPKRKESMFTICTGASPDELELVDAATVVAPRQGAWTIGIAYPGCAAARRPWAVEFNRFAVAVSHTGKHHQTAGRWWRRLV